MVNPKANWGRWAIELRHLTVVPKRKRPLLHANGRHTLEIIAEYIAAAERAENVSPCRPVGESRR
jgi:hypothetical protein